MSRIVFDIETVGVDFEGLDKSSQESLLKNAKTEEEQQAIKDCLALSPLTGKIVAIGMVDYDTNDGVVFFQSSNGKDKDFKENNSKYIVCSEKEIIENFWKIVTKYTQIVTYNGRGFDCPFIMLRSAAHRCKPTRDIMPYRFDIKSHIDLYDQMTFYGSMRKGFSLHMVTQALGIKSPKEEGVSGAMVSDLFKQEKSIDIARYCLRDVRATKELCEIWQQYIKP
ncbi:MAG: ribonuclease H-like domain-containing protein [Candidatus Omnitrophica bacterium]|nr:ribonuclease H-like domain-containing protein [Candidatus Omnitrophota bacterium]